MMTARNLPTLAVVLSLLASVAFVETGSAQAEDPRSEGPTQPGDLKLVVPPIQQSRTTSCGEAAIAMAYDYAYPEDAISEEPVIEYAKSEGLYTPQFAPFTSPVHMVTIAQDFAGQVETGNVKSSAEGLTLLTQELQVGQPVIIDITTYLGDLSSGAHFVLVTGLSIDPLNGTSTISYDNPLTGELESANWAGSEGVWNAWESNGDPGGSGWWLVIPMPGSASNSRAMRTSGRLKLAG